MINVGSKTDPLYKYFKNLNYLIKKYEYKFSCIYCDYKKKSILATNGNIIYSIEGYYIKKFFIKNNILQNTVFNILNENKTFLLIKMDADFIDFNKYYYPYMYIPNYEKFIHQDFNNQDGWFIDMLSNFGEVNTDFIKQIFQKDIKVYKFKKVDEDNYGVKIAIKFLDNNKIINKCLLYIKKIRS